MDVYQPAAGLTLPLVYLKVQSWDPSIISACYFGCTSMACDST